MRRERLCPGSISHGEIRKRPRSDANKSTRNVEFCLPNRISDVDGSSRSMHVHVYDPAAYHVMERERDSNIGRAAPFKGKSTAIEGKIAEPYCEICAKEQSRSLEIDINQCVDDKFRSHDHLIRSSLTESYKDRERVIYARQGSLAAHHTAHGPEFSGYIHNNGFRRPPSCNLKRKIPEPYGDDGIFPSPPDNTYRIRSLELVKSSAYPNSIPVAARRNDENVENQLMHHSQFGQSGYDTHGNDHEELHYIKQQKIIHENHLSHGHSCKSLHEMKHPCAQLHYNCSQIKNHIRDFSAPYFKHADGMAVIGDYGNASHSAACKHASLGKLDVPRCCEEANAPQQHGKLLEFMYISPEYDYRPLQNRTAINFGLRDDHILRSRLDPGFQTDADSKNLQVNYHSEEMPIYGRKPCGIAARLQRVNEDDGMHMPKEHMDNTIYRDEEDFHRDHYHMMTRNLNTFEYKDLEDCDALVNEQNVSGIYGSSSHTDESGIIEMTYPREVSQRRIAPKERVSVKNRLGYLPEHPFRYVKYRGKGTSMIPKSGHMKGFQSNHHIGKTTGFYKSKNIVKANEGYFEDNLAHEYDHSVDEENLEEPELPEDSDEFKQLTNEAFLKYSKRININSAVQQRYRAQGKAGSLFCIVCSRRFSKEFRTTEDLVKHAFMTRRAQLRANHLGLQRAICVLMGWDTYLPEEMPTVSPRVLPDEEALTIKEDLIVWPPVVILRNISMSIDHPGDQKVVTIESLKAYLRGKGYADGKMHVCLGRPADQSVMIVKFLGTFSGFGNALKLHQFFADNKRGRIDFQKLISSRGERGADRSSFSSGVGGKGEAEQIMYGYMGIAEDLDEVDFRTKNCEIKSKKEIQDFADEPVKN
ncbi:hypothetical protein SAY87_019297 [Trapa incisa]|uniref:XS domain-containing protein n=1 Tax=Trapa incisa TaxID=236973 RepID=A0AAN7Q1U1_9MYRT|nr:hypothetical protein SAY87_019297 [Trapa incisa]